MAATPIEFVRLLDELTRMVGICPPALARFDALLLLLFSCVTPSAGGLEQELDCDKRINELGGTADVEQQVCRVPARVGAAAIVTACKIGWKSLACSERSGGRKKDEH